MLRLPKQFCKKKYIFVHCFAGGSIRKPPVEKKKKEPKAPKKEEKKQEPKPKPKKPPTPEVKSDPFFAMETENLNVSIF